MENKQPLLSICIPTYKRSQFLRISLERFRQAIKPYMEIELIVSDNCSPDDTPVVVQNVVDNGLSCKYIRNEKNLGPDANFLQCFHEAKGKYIWLCGDDDFILPEKLKHLYDLLASNDYGLIELNTDSSNFKLSPKVMVDAGDFLSEVHVWITFVSGNIFRKEVVAMIDSEKYKESFLIQTPYFLTSATMGFPNVMYYPQVLETGADSANNGGYNLFQVFCQNLLSMIHDKVDEGKLTEQQFKCIKKSIFCKWMISYYERFFFRHDYGSFKMENAREILHKWYGKEPYYYIAIAEQYLKHIIKKIIGRV